MIPTTKKPPYPFGTVVKVKKDGKTYTAILPDGTDVTDKFENYQLRHAVEKNMALKLVETTNGYQWRNTPMSEFQIQTPDTSSADDHSTIVEFLKTAPSVRPTSYKMDDLKWRFAVRTVLRGKNIIIVGPKGTGKTVLAFTLRDTLDRPFFNIPMGASQDPRSTLLGNVHFDPAKGTFVGEAEFIRAIQTENAIILLDEISRAHPDAWNILMTPLDYKQRFVRIDEAPDTPVIPVANGVTFIMTANIGAQYTATRTMDAALLDRCVVVEVGYLSRDQELELLKERVKGVDEKILLSIAACADEIRVLAKNGDTLTEGLSTRNTIEWAELCYDGFTFNEGAQLVVEPQFSDAGGSESERAVVRQIIQKHTPVNNSGKTGPFNTDSQSDTELPWE
jgi:nitric oxide reductase NorQ protein